MAKNLVVCRDGTANEFARHHANVVEPKRRTIPRQAMIHWSVFERGGNYAQGLQLPPDHERVPKPPGKP
jgi:hypothetical protein